MSVASTAQQLDFDGNRSVALMNESAIPDSFSINFWLKPNAPQSSGTILSQDNGQSNIGISINGDRNLLLEFNHQQLLSYTKLPTNEWHHISVRYDNNLLSLLIDGVVDNSKKLTSATILSGRISLGAKVDLSGQTSNNLRASVDELQIWDTALSIDQQRYLMNQEISHIGNSTIGKITNNTTKNELASVMWSSLRFYYTMEQYNGQLIDKSTYVHNAAINFPSSSQTAPLPYSTAIGGAWEMPETWANGNVMQLPNSVSIVDNRTLVNWNVVQSNGNLISLGNRILLGLLVNSGQFTMANDTKLLVTHYLKLNGKIDLQGKSQLVQNTNSELDPTSNGILERDQKGTSNVYNYNYWCSPVGAVNDSINNADHTAATVLRDGTNPENPQEILWTAGLDGSFTSPITLSSYWIFKFQNVTPFYSNWSALGQNGTLKAGEGFTLKGDNAPLETQNFVFIGKPNNGDITSPIAAGNLNLTGNPYPSALDVDQFLHDNMDSTGGTIYLWEHSNINNSHYLIDYQGGYAARTLVGGVPAISQTASVPKIPGKYIPVGQGFFIKGGNVGGMIKFNNGQRAFIKETNASSSAMFRTPSSAGPSYIFDNTEDQISNDDFAKIRIGFNTSDNHHRSILLGFMNQYATDGLDQGYDAQLIDYQVSDMYFTLSSNRLVIQGVGNFSDDKIYNLGVTMESEGTINIVFDGTENFPADVPLFIYDNLTSQYHDLRSGPLTVTLTSGTFDDRFSLRFSNPALAIAQYASDDNLIQCLSRSKELRISAINREIYSATIFNNLGQEVMKLEVDDLITQKTFPLTDLGSGVYIVTVKGRNLSSSKKIVLQ